MGIDGSEEWALALAGCITAGREVVILPAKTGLRADGSITVAGKRYAQGSTIALGGGVGSTPTDWRCGAAADYWLG